MCASSLATDIDVAVEDDPAMRELLAHLLTLPPDAFVMNALAEVDVAALSDVDAVTYLQLHQKVAAWWTSRMFAAVLPAASPEPMRREGIVLALGSEEERTVWIEEWSREELALALRLPSATAQDLIDTARLLAGPLAAHPRRDRGVLCGVRGAGAPGAAHRPPDDRGADSGGGEPGRSGHRWRG